MPRVRVPHASFNASADLPILPFLAPRVFAESPISRRNHSQHVKSDRVSAEEEKASACRNSIDSVTCKFEAQDSRWRYGPSSSLPRRHDGPAAGLRLPHITRLQCNSGQNGTQSRHIHHLYADISSFARQHARSYATDSSVIHRAANRTPSSPRRSRGTRPTRVASVLAQHGPMLAAKRDKALALEQRRLANYVSRLPPGLSVADRHKKGQYRSLCRRISNLQYWDATTLDLKGLVGDAAKRSVLTRAFASLDRALYPSLGQHTRKIRIEHDPHCVRLSAKLFQPPRASWKQVRRNWLELDMETRKTWFERLLLYLLDRKSSRALPFIQTLATDPLLRDMRSEAIADALGHLAKVHSRKAYVANHGWAKSSEANKSEFVPAFVHIFREALAKQKDICSQDLLYNLVGLAGTEDLKRVFDCLVEVRTRFGFDTLLHYANAFGEAGEFQYALRCLDELKARHSTVAWQSVVDRQRLRWSCALILRNSMSKSKDYHETPGIVASFVRLGIKMDILLYNVVMHNAMEAGDYVTAFKVYNTLESNGLKPDKRTLSILLHGCSSQSNPAMFQNFAQHCAEVAQDTKDPWLATDYLFYVYIRHQNDPDLGQASASLWQAYLDFFSGTSLEHFIPHGSNGSGNAVIKKRHAPTSSLLEPPPMAMYIMLQMEIRSALAISTQRVLNLYRKFKSLASGPDFKVLTRNPTIWNAFLLAFCQKQQFASASQVIKDMTEGSPQPNVYSWNIFMQAFFKTGQVQAAERVFEIMRSRGVDPDQFTYGVLLRGYARAQLVERIGDTMQNVNTEQEMDPGLLRALAKVVDRRRLMYTLEKSRVEKEARAREIAEKLAEEERERWELSRLTPLLPDPSSTPTSADRDAPIEQETLDQLFREPLLPPQELTAVLQEPIVDYDETGSFLQEPSNILQEPPIVGSASEEAVTVPPSPPAKSDSYDPNLQYRSLEGKLGVVRPNPSSNLSSESHAHQNGQINPFGVGLGFKSMLLDGGEQPDVSKDLSESSIGSMLPNEQGPAEISKGLSKFNVRRLLSRETPVKKGK